MRAFWTDILGFFRREKGYGVLFISLLCIWGVLTFSPGEAFKEVPQDSRAYEEFRHLEERMHESVKEAGSIDEYLKDRPHLAFWYNLLTLVIMGGCVAGIGVLAAWALNPGWRARTRVPEAASAVRWPFSMLFKAILIFSAVSFAASIVLGFFHRFLQWDLTTNFYILLHTTLMDLFILGLVFWMVYRAGGNGQDLGLRLPAGQPAPEVRSGLLAYTGLVPLFTAGLFLVLFLSKIFHYEPPPHPLVNVFLEEGRAPGMVTYSLFLALVFGPVVEEIFFRGFCYPVLKKQFGTGWGMVLTSLFFAWIHGNAFVLVPIFILGMGLVYVYELRRSIAAPIVMHLTHNAIFVSYFFIARKIIVESSAGM